MVWHGATATGVRAKQSYCEAWHTDSVSNVGLASDLTRSQLLGQEKVGCHNKLIVLCVEIASQSYRRRRREAPVPPRTTLFGNRALNLDDDYDDNIILQTEEESKGHEEGSSQNILSKDNSSPTTNLTFEQYTQLLDDYDGTTSDEDHLA
jgi:hypothetical protein